MNRKPREEITQEVVHPSPAAGEYSGSVRTVLSRAASSVALLAGTRTRAALASVGAAAHPDLPTAVDTRLRSNRFFPTLSSRVETLLRFAACIICAALAVLFLQAIAGSGLALAQVGAVEESVNSARTDITTIGFGLLLLALALGFILIAYPSSGAMAKKWGAAFLVGGVIGLVGLGSVTVLGTMIEGWGADGGGGGGGN